MTPLRMSRTGFAVLAVSLCVGCHLAGAGTSLAPSPTAASYPDEITGQATQGALSVSIQWPRRTQVIPTSAQRLSFVLSGPHPQSLDVLRPPGEAPVSVATMSVEVGTGYRLDVSAFDASPQARLVAAGQSALFNVKANEIAKVRIRLASTLKPVITGFSPDNGGPGASVEIYGQYLGYERGLMPDFLFGESSTTQRYPAQDGTASTLVPLDAVSGAIAPVVDGVSGEAFGTFTVLKAIAIHPLSLSVASGSTASFEAIATTSANAPFAGTPAVQWSAYAPYKGEQAGYRVAGIITDPTPEPPPYPGQIDPWGVFTADGATGTFEVAILSGRLLATASVTVTE
ncbi:hypothetical protein J7643_19255 [bacterium]|nr:hypothetical protein [bacterium]